MPFYLLVGTVAMLAGGIASISGMGIGSLLIPLLAVRYGVKTAVPNALALRILFLKGLP